MRADTPTDLQQGRLEDVASVWVTRSPLSGSSDRQAIQEIVNAIRSGDRWSADSRFVKRDGSSWVWLGSLRTASDDVDLVIKGRVGSRFGLISDRHAIKQAIGAARLLKIGVATSEPVALLNILTGSGVRAHWFVLRALEGESLAHELARGERSFAVDAGLARCAGALVRTLCEAGLFNRDHKASNLIVLATGAIGIVDTVAIKRRRGCEQSRRRMLLAMCKELAGIGAMPRRSQLMRCLLSASVDPRADWRAIERMLREAGDTTPRVDPLGV